MKKKEKRHNTTAQEAEAYIEIRERIGLIFFFLRTNSDAMGGRLARWGLGS